MSGAEPMIDRAPQSPAPETAMPAAAPPPVFSQAAVEAPPAPAPKPAQTHTVWSSTPGDGQHFEPKE
jgi:hypothetical protein